MYVRFSHLFVTHCSFNQGLGYVVLAYVRKVFWSHAIWARQFYVLYVRFLLICDPKNVMYARFL